jgi:dephospho-CoA kinase
MIGRSAAARAEAALRAGAQLIVFDVPLLAESGHWRERVDRVLVVDCGEATQEQRVAARPGWSVEAARGVIAQQVSRARRRAIADAVIFNDGIDLAQLAAEVQSLHALWRGLR